MPALEAVTWATFVVEISLPLLVWFRPVRIPVVLAVVVSHLSIDYQMNLFLFQWLMILGWLSFLATTDLEPWKNRFRKRQPAPAA